MKDPIDNDFLNDCRRITSEYDRLMGSWTLEAGVLHVISELMELQDVLRNKDDKYGKTLSKKWYKKFYDELADCHLTQFSLDNLLDTLQHPNGKVSVTNQELNDAIKKKLKIVDGRVLKLKKKRNLK